jgi:hypothetical protein
VEAEVIHRREKDGRSHTMRKVLYALASLAAFAMAVGAGWRPN